MASTLQVFNNGPLKLEGEFEIKDQSGNVHESTGKKAVFLCRCGKSANKPFCDGAHKGAFEHTFECENAS